ncbi:hypothetical protein AB0E81_33285 [Streptomyces sp. NPDC033538]|uniref:hypothetical protein n=1 Tax=Streptomyces sp. NPDC033538 TaxID=3155367 RepID=UPI0033C232EF
MKFGQIGGGGELAGDRRLTPWAVVARATAGLSSYTWCRTTGPSRTVGCGGGRGPIGPPGGRGGLPDLAERHGALAVDRVPLGPVGGSGVVALWCRGRRVG